jgi:hypothetical protein
VGPGVLTSRTTDAELKMIRPWRVVAPDGTIVETSSTFSEAEIALRDGDTMQLRDPQHGWRDVPTGEFPAEETG